MALKAGNKTCIAIQKFVWSILCASLKCRRGVSTGTWVNNASIYFTLKGIKPPDTHTTNANHKLYVDRIVNLDKLPILCAVMFVISPIQPLLQS